MDTTATQTLRSIFETIRDERNTHANTAERIGNAFLSMLSYLSESPYLRKDQTDATQFLLKLLGGVSIGTDGQDNALSGANGKGILLGQKGDVEADSLLIRGAAMFQELIVNKTSVLDGDQYFSSSDIIDKVTLRDDLTYILDVRSLYEGYKAQLQAGDVVFSKLDNQSGDGSSHTSWFRVDSVDTSLNQLIVTPYSASMCPGGVNFPPEAGAKCAQRGNATNEERQSVWYLSSTEKGLFFYVGVTKPIIDESNIYLFVGIPPKGLSFLEGKPINYSHPYVYCRGLIYQDLIHIDYQGNPVYTIRDLGLWLSDHQYIRGVDNNNYYQDQTWFGGCVWRCAADKTTIGLAPRYNNTEWNCVSGTTSFTAVINSSAGSFFRVGAAISSTLTAVIKHAEMILTEEEITKACITWTRTSTSAEGDAAWNALHATGTCGLSIHITNDDMPSDWLTTRQVAFTVTVTLPSINQTVSDSYTISV